MTTAQKTLNDSNAALIETLTGKKPVRYNKKPAPLWFAILTDSLRPTK